MHPPPQVRNGRTYLNGVMRNEPFIPEEPQYEMPALVVPPGDVSGMLAPGWRAGESAVLLFTSSAVVISRVPCGNRYPAVTAASRLGRLPSLRSDR